MAANGGKKGKGGEKKVFEKKVVVPRTATQQQSYKLAKLLNNPVSISQRCDSNVIKKI